MPRRRHGALMDPRAGWRRRRGSRGAALVESVVIMPVFLLLFAGLVFISNLYSAKMVAMEDARVGAWAYASFNCGGWPRNSPSGLKKSAKGEMGMATGEGFTQVTSGGLVHTKTNRREPLSVRVSEKRTVTCNEAPLDGDLHSMAQDAIHLLLELGDETTFVKSQVGRAVSAAGQLLRH
jgi:hypothetical protein